ILRKALVRLNREAVINGVGVAFQCRDARKTSDRPRLRNAVHREGLRWSDKSNDRWGLGPLEVDIARAREMRALHPEIVHLERHRRLDLVFQAQVALLHVRFMIVRLENENRWNPRRTACWRSAIRARDRRAALGVWILR